MHMFVCEIIADFIELALFLIGLYYAAVGVFSLLPRRDLTAPDREPLSFAVLIPAHNEERVIAQAVKSVLAADYPGEKLSVYVIADDCSDGTAYIAEKLDARVIKKSGGSGKFAALKFASERMFSENERPDLVTVIDADNVVSPAYFAEMNKAARERYGAVQGKVETKNPERNWLTAAYSVWSALETRLGRMAPGSIGLNVKLSGTGYCVRAEVFEELMGLEDCLAEDMEFTAHLALIGVKTAFCGGAVVYDEKPASLGCSLRQRIRWARGIVSVQGRYGWELLRRGKITDFLSLYGDFLGLFTYALFGVLSFFAGYAMLNGLHYPLIELWTKPISYAALCVYLGIGLMTALAGLVLDRKFNKAAVVNLIGLLIYTVTWVPAAVAGLLSHHRKEWYHTEHDC